jgi:hypothetical protein
VVRLQIEGGETVVHTPGSGWQPIEVPEAELWSSFRVAARNLVAPADPLAFAEQTFGLTEASETYRYYAHSGLLVPDSFGFGLEGVGSSAERLTRGYLGWCGGTGLRRSADCLHLLGHSQALTLHGRYVVTLVMAMTASFGPMLDSLRELADPNAVAVMLASAVAVYLLLWLVPEPISKLISISITGALIGYLGLEMFWNLVYGWRALATEVDAATDFGQLQGAAQRFGKVLGPQMGQLLILLVSHSLGRGLAAKGTASPPRFAEATAQTQRLTRVRLGTAAAGVRSITLDSSAITISLASGATAVAVASSMAGGATTEPPPGGGSSNEQGRSRSAHAEQGRAEGRRIGPAFNDAQRARQSDVFVQPDGRYVVRGPRGREHVFESNGTHVTSIDRSQSAHTQKVARGERAPASAKQFETFMQLFR